MPTLTDEAKSYLRQFNAAARKNLGQNFMVSETALARIADAAVPEGAPQVLEIGPGLGFLTRVLLDKGVRVLAVEKDPAFCRLIKDVYAARDLKLIERDILRVDLGADFGLTAPVCIAGNIPYNITSPILEWLIAQRTLVSQAVLTTQRELADRLCSSPGSKQWGALSVFLQVYAEVSILFTIGREAFYPAPNVDSAVVRVRFLPKPRVTLPNEAGFFQLVRKAFQKRRKTVLNALKSESEGPLSKEPLLAALQHSRIDAMRRPETLSIEEWSNLLSHLNSP